MLRLFLLPAIAAGAVLAAGPAAAHVPGLALGAGGGLAAGLTHPFLGADHLLAMLAVGLLAVQQGGRALWALPAAFVAAMALGLGIGLMGIGAVPLEIGIAGSVIVLGGLVAWARALPLAALVGLVALSALLHGHAHGLELPAHASTVGYAAGTLVGTVLLHGLGIAGALALTRLRADGWGVRATGTAFAAIGAVLLII